MFKKLLLSILCLSTLSSQAAPWINAKLLYPFIAAQTAAAAGYYFNNAYKRHKSYLLEKREDHISQLIQEKDSLSFFYAGMYYRIPTQYNIDQNGNKHRQCQALQNIRDELEFKIHTVQKAINNQKTKKIKLMINPPLYSEEDIELLKEYEKLNIRPPEDIHTRAINTGFASSNGYIIHISLKDMVKLYKLSGYKNHVPTKMEKFYKLLSYEKHEPNQQATTKMDVRSYENHLQKIYAGLGHEISHIENKDIEKNIVATATIPFATEGIWQIGAKLFKRKPSPSHLSSFQFLYKTVAQLPIGVAKFYLTSILCAYYRASQEYQCDKQSMEYMGKTSTEALIKWFESRADAHKKYIKEKYSHGLPFNDSMINIISIIKSEYPSHKYRAERLKKLLEKEEQK